MPNSRAEASAAASILYPGIARADVNQQRDDPTRFVLVEVCRTMEAIVAHKETAHHATWRDTVAFMLADARYGVQHTNVFPDEPGR